MTEQQRRETRNGAPPLAALLVLAAIWLVGTTGDAADPVRVVDPLAAKERRLIEAAAIGKDGEALARAVGGAVGRIFRDGHPLAPGFEEIVALAHVAAEAREPGGAHGATAPAEIVAVVLHHQRAMGLDALDAARAAGRGLARGAAAIGSDFAAVGPPAAAAARSVLGDSGWRAFLAGAREGRAIAAAALRPPGAAPARPSSSRPRPTSSDPSGG